MQEVVVAADRTDFTAHAAVARSHRSLGLTLGAMGDVDAKIAELGQAAAMYERLAAADPADGKVVRYLAETWADLGQAELDRAVRMLPADVSAPLRAARSFLERAQASYGSFPARELSVLDVEALVRIASTLATCASLDAVRGENRAKPARGSSTHAVR